MDMETRLATLERDAKRSQRLAFAALCLATMGILSGGVRANRDTVEAQQFVVIDGSGKTRATFGTKGHAVGLSLYEAGEHAVGLSASPDGAVLDLTHPSGVAARLGALQNGGGLTVSDRAGHRRLVAGVGADGTPDVELRDGAGRRVSR